MAIAKHGIRKNRSAMCAMNAIRGIRLSGKAMPAKESITDCHAGIDFVFNKIIPSTIILIGNNGPEPKSNNCDVKG